MTAYHVQAIPVRDGWNLYITGPDFDRWSYVNNEAKLADFPNIAREFITRYTNNPDDNINITLTFDSTPFGYDG